LSPLLLYIAILVFFLALSVFFSAAETAYMAVNRLRLKYQAEAGDKQAEAIKKILSNPDRLLGVLLFGVTVAEIAAAGIFSYLATSWVSPRYAEIAGFVGSILFALIVLLFCELTPKIIAAAHPEQVSRKLLLPVRLTIQILSPFSPVWNPQAAPSPTASAKMKSGR
jgi:Mg2+/Co2+ transporter CorB